MRVSQIRILSALIVVILAIYGLFPVKDIPFDKYIVKAVTHDKSEFEKLFQRAKKDVSVGNYNSFYLAIRETANAENIDLSKFFKNKSVADIGNLQEKNKVLLNALLSESRSKIKRGLDLQGGVSFVLQVVDAKFDKLSAIEKKNQLVKAIDIIRSRIDTLGVTEPIVRIFGNNSIEIQLPGISTRDNPEIVDVVKKPAKLEFRLLHPTSVPKSKTDPAPIGYEILPINRPSSDGKDGDLQYVFVKKIPELTGRMVKKSGVVVGQYGEYNVALTMTEEGSKLFEKITAENINRQLGIVLDKKLYSAPVIRSAISNGHASVTGNFSQREAFELSNVLNNPLEVELKFIELNEIGPSLAEDAKISSINASVMGALIVAAFMLFYYHIAGFVSLMSVTANVVIVAGVMSIIGATLTLPGIAALVLTIAMAIDANILIFERMREELLSGKTLKSALLAGHNRAFSSIFDANLTTLLIAAILIYFGTGPIKGFGVILSIGIIATMFCALVLNRGILEVLVEKDLVKTLIPSFRLKPKFFDYLKWSRVIFIIYFLIVVIGSATIFMKKNKIYGIDFSGGDEITLKFDKKISTKEIHDVAIENKIGEVISIYQKSFSDSSEILRIQTEREKGISMFECLKNKFQDSDLSLLKKVEIGSSIGQNVKFNAFMSVLISMVGIMIYIAFRFETGYGIAAIVSTLSNVVITMIIYLSIGHQISAPMVASILMVVGYSINDTIIVFDRIREELGSNNKKSLGEIINLSINRTLSRTLLTSISTFFAALALYIFGSGVIVDFSLVFLIGVVVGTFSSIFIASPIFYKYHRGEKTTIPGAVIC